MPQDNLRSGLYRSFIMCDDPRGVVESGAIRKQKSRTGSSNGGSRRSERTGSEKEQSGRPSEEKTEMRGRITEEISLNNATSSLQLLRVSRGIQKLNNAIESWSKGLSYEKRPEDIATDLLRGALDLEESLAMLGKVHRASSEYIKQKPRTTGHEKSKKGEVRIQRSMSERFGEPNQEKGFEKPRISDDGSSRDCYEELRKAIKESFLRQNLILRQTAGEKTRICRSNLASSSGAASTSSSQSSTVHRDDSGSTKSSLSWDIPPSNSTKGPNLIARLMGLDEFPLKPAKSATAHTGKPEIRKPSMEGEEQMKKKEILETVQYKRVIRSNSVKDIVLESPPSSPPKNCCPEEIPMDNRSTIVLIKPQRVPQPESEGKLISKTPVVPRKLRMQGEIHPRMISQRKEATGSGRTSNKMKVELSLPERDRGLREMVSKAEENIGKKTKQMASSSTKTSNTASKAPKPVITNKKLAKKEDGERHKPHDAVLRAPDDHVKHKKSRGTSDIAKNKVSTERRSSLDSKSTSEQKRVRIKKVGETTRVKAKKKLHQEDNEGSDLTLEKNSVFSRDTIGSANQLSSEEETSSSEFRIQGHCHSREISSCDASTEHSYDKKDSETSTDIIHCDPGIPLKSFLSSSPAFLYYAEDLFDLNTNEMTTISSSVIQSNNLVMISDQKLSLDCAKELARHKSLHLSHAKHPGRICISLDELLMGVSEGFEALRSYSNTFSGQNYLSDNVHMTLEKDLKGRNTEMASEMWDLGWRTGFRIDDTDQVVIDVEKLILFGLIEEILS